MFKIARYEIKTKIGSGGMADILGAYDPLFEREVAIKVIKADLSKNPNIHERFKLEAQIMASLTHDAIVPIHDFGENNGKPYFVMALMSGGSLTARIQQGPLSLFEATQLLERIAPALDMAHQEGVVHRDLKPDNILLDEAGQPYIADFGIAKLIESTIQQTLDTQGPIGTPAYMSPEQIRGDKNIDGRSDIYSLGVILFQMLTGKRPYEGRTFAQLIHKHLHEPVPNIHTFKPDLRVGCQKVIERAMAKNRDARYGSASEMVVELKRVPEGKTPVDITLILIVVVIVSIIGQLLGTSTPTPSPTSTPFIATSSPTSTPFIATSSPTSMPTSTPIPATPSPPPTATQSAECLVRGDAYYNKGEYKQALVEYNQCIALNPNNPLFYSKRGQAFYKIEEYYSAIDDFTLAIDLGLIHQLKVVCNNRGNAYRHIGEYGLAILDHTKAIKLDPKYSRAYANRGVAYYKNQEYEKAIQDLDEAIELEPSDFSRARHYNNRAKVHKEIGNYDQALADCQEAIRLDPNYSSAYNICGSVSEELGEFEKAREYYEQVLKLNQGDEANAEEDLD